MKKIISFLLIILVTFMMTGCYSSRNISMLDDYDHACRGLNRDNTIATFGEPNRTYLTEAGEVFVYESYEGEQTVANRKYLELTFDKQGICRGIQTNHTKPTKYRDDKKTNWAVWGSIAGTAVGVGTITGLIYLIMNISRK